MFAARERENKSPARIHNVNYFSPSVIFPKLTISQPNDKYEQEADAMAEKVMSMPEEKLQRQKEEPEKLVQTMADIQRQEEDEEKEKIQTLPYIQSQEEDKEEESVQTKSRSGGMQVSPALQGQLQSSKGGGSVLPAATNRFMSNAFGADLSEVRVHTDAHANQMNESIHARAFTHGSDIYLKEGQYNPDSSEGKRLLAHELGHIQQQNKQDYQDNTLMRKIYIFNKFSFNMHEDGSIIVKKKRLVIKILRCYV